MTGNSTLTVTVAGWFTMIRGFQLVLALVVVILDAYLLHYLPYIDMYIYSVCLASVTVITSIYYLVATMSLPNLYNVWAIISIDASMVLLWLISCGLTAFSARNWITDYMCIASYCYVDDNRGAGSLYVIEVPLWIVTVVVACIAAKECVLFFITLIGFSNRLHHDRRAGYAPSCSDSIASDHHRGSPTRAAVPTTTEHPPNPPPPGSAYTQNSQRRQHPYQRTGAPLPTAHYTRYSNHPSTTRHQATQQAPYQSSSQTNLLARIDSDTAATPSPTSIYSPLTPSTTTTRPFPVVSPLHGPGSNSGQARQSVAYFPLTTTRTTPRQHSVAVATPPPAKSGGKKRPGGGHGPRYYQKQQPPPVPVGVSELDGSGR